LSATSYSIPDGVDPISVTLTISYPYDSNNPTTVPLSAAIGAPYNAFIASSALSGIWRPSIVELIAVFPDTLE